MKEERSLVLLLTLRRPQVLRIPLLLLLRVQDLIPLRIHRRPRLRRILHRRRRRHHRHRGGQPQEVRMDTRKEGSIIQNRNKKVTVIEKWYAK